MTKVINMSLTAASIDAAIQEIKEYKAFIRRKTTEFAARLADDGAVMAMLRYDQAYYRGPRDVDVTVEELGNNRFLIVANGETVLILEFGAGITFYGSGHPMAEELGYGPGTYPGQKHAFDPVGWWIPKDKGGGHSSGNPPSKAMFKTAKELRERIADIAREVFGS